MFDRFAQFFRGYSLFEVFFELAVIWVCVYLVFRFLRGTRGAGVIKGVALIFVLFSLLIRVLGQQSDTFAQLNFIYDRFLGVLAILLIVVFQPELRQAMIKLGHASFFRTSKSQIGNVVEAITDAVAFLSKSQFGALIAVERDVRLGGLIEGGQNLDAEISARLLQSIFWPNSPLHDLGVVVRGDRVLAAGVQFPLAEEGLLPPEYGSRHRAALGLAMDSDCLVVIVSEETGAISIAQDGRIDFNLPRDEFHDILMRRLEAEPEATDEPAAADDSPEAVETQVKETSPTGEKQAA